MSHNLIVQLDTKSQRYSSIRQRAAWRQFSVGYHLETSKIELNCADFAEHNFKYQIVGLRFLASIVSTACFAFHRNLREPGRRAWISNRRRTRTEYSNCAHAGSCIACFSFFGLYSFVGFATQAELADFSIGLWRMLLFCDERARGVANTSRHK